MKVKYKSESEIHALVRSFEEATMAQSDFKHAEHLVVALYYVTHHDLETATSKMRDGIFKLLREAFAIDLTKDMPYHETLTVFWMRIVDRFNSSRNGETLIDKANELVAAYDKDYPLKFYSREYLFSTEARTAYVQPDRKDTDRWP